MCQLNHQIKSKLSSFVDHQQNKNVSVTKKKGGPYTKDERKKRQDEVRRLHFEYGYPARKIAEMMNINRNTINADIDYLYNGILINTDFLNLEGHIMMGLERLDIQRSRLRENLDKSENFQQRYAMEKMILDIECKIVNINMKLADSTKRIQNLKINHLNDYLKTKGEETRYMSLFDKIAVSEKAYEKISKIMRNDRNKAGL